MFIQEAPERENPSPERENPGPERENLTPERENLAAEPIKTHYLLCSSMNSHSSEAQMFKNTQPRARALRHPSQPALV